MRADVEAALLTVGASVCAIVITVRTLSIAFIPEDELGLASLILGLLAMW
ncbi:MAG: hypothetical protein ACHQK9_19700 [Reyranellales bacterium]